MNAYLQAAASRHGVDHHLLKAVVAAESGFNPLAVSPKGAVGLMQLMPATAQQYGVLADTAPARNDRGEPLPLRSVSQKLTDARLNLDVGARHLAYLLRLYPGRLELAVAAYNAGEGAVQRAGRAVPNYRETQGYVKSVLGLYAQFRRSAPVQELNQGDAVARAPATTLDGRSQPPSAAAKLSESERIRIALGADSLHADINEPRTRELEQAR